MARKVFFLVNDKSEFSLRPSLKKHLPRLEYQLSTAFPRRPEEFSLIIPWNYRKILPQVVGLNNVVIFHSSNLPQGRGWAPIYHAIADGHRYHTLSAIIADEQVDHGRLVAKARFRILPQYTASILRQFDADLTAILIEKLLLRLKRGALVGIAQKGKPSYYPRRYPQDNQFSPQQKLVECLPHLRACEPQHPAHFFYRGVKYIVEVRPEELPSFPADYEIIYLDE